MLVHEVTIASSAELLTLATMPLAYEPGAGRPRAGLRLASHEATSARRAPAARQRRRSCSTAPTTLPGGRAREAPAPRRRARLAGPPGARATVFVDQRIGGAHQETMCFSSG
ncbi:unnamed protein product [Prorocentrum cordatum]|uniref:Uncharacterized protein n=1 Tax=Prorocentrum cordatum TaxID=2364126 RepID=A0ABN9V2U8_9DINO|nr:unnamed protein product [Polarella glacialis]